MTGPIEPKQFGSLASTLATDRLFTCDFLCFERVSDWMTLYGRKMSLEVALYRWATTMRLSVTLPPLEII